MTHLMRQKEVHISFYITLKLVQGEILLLQSSACDGGGILAKSSTLYVDQESKFSIHSCVSGDTGGGMYLYHSKVYTLKAS